MDDPSFPWFDLLAFRQVESLGHQVYFAEIKEDLLIGLFAVEAVGNYSKTDVVAMSAHSVDLAVVREAITVLEVVHEQSPEVIDWNQNRTKFHNFICFVFNTVLILKEIKT